MARALNLLIIEGNMGKDPEMRYTPAGKPVTQFSVATSRPFKNQSDEWDEETTWFRVVVFGDQAERIAEKGEKGSFVRVQGRIHSTEWDAPDCSKGKHFGWEVIADRVDVLGRFESSGGDYGRSRTDAYVDQLGPGRRVDEHEPVAAGHTAAGGAAGDMDLDDLPF